MDGVTREKRVVELESQPRDDDIGAVCAPIVRSDAATIGAASNVMDRAPSLWSDCVYIGGSFMLLGAAVAGYFHWNRLLRERNLSRATAEAASLRKQPREFTPQECANRHPFICCCSLFTYRIDRDVVAHTAGCCFIMGFCRNIRCSCL